MKNIATLSREFERSYALFSVLIAGLLISLAGSLSIPLPFTPVPLALRSLVVFGVSVWLGSARNASFAVLVFLFQAACGLPVLAGGLKSFFGPTGGYLVGYLVAAFLIGLFCEKVRQKNLFSWMILFSVATGVIYLFGASYLSLFVKDQAILLGVVPFLIGDAVKVLVATVFASFLKKV